jgi:hypothetical protein
MCLAFRFPWQLLIALGNRCKGHVGELLKGSAYLRHPGTWDRRLVERVLFESGEGQRAGVAPYGWPTIRLRSQFASLKTRENALFFACIASKHDKTLIMP